MRKPRKPTQGIQIRQFSQIICRKHQVLQVRYRGRQRRLDVIYAVAREQ
jgi:hypothetical protein